MKQILQSFKTGDTVLEDFPVPNIGPGSILIQTSHSLVSLGTERMLVEFARQPDAHLNFVAFDWMTQGQLLSLPMVALGVYLLLRKVPIPN